ncbi:MAG TPA: VWA domain-containing protein [Terriglobales bacterium]|nr:VWA domain-containing protein [Terriglobales bacterium]
MRFVLALAALVGLTAAAQTSAPPQRPAPGDKAPTYRVDVKLVSVFVTVTDDRGAPVPSLQKEDFEVREDGVEQKLAVFDRESTLPLSIVLAIDASLSTRKDLKLELDAARAFAHSVLRSQDTLALFQFSEIVDELVPFTSDLRVVDRGIARVHVGAATALYDAIFLGSQALMRRQGRKVLVVITDGGDTMSRVDYQGALRQAQQADALVYSIIMVPIEASAGRNTGGEHALIQMSEDTGGKYYYADTPQQIDRAFRRISDELRTQYLLGYYPRQRLSDSDFRRIQVKVTPPADADFPLPLHSRHRTGYYTSKAE